MPEQTSSKHRHRSKKGLKGFYCPHCRTSQEFKTLPIKGLKDVVMVLLWRYPMRCIRCLKSFYGPRRLLKHIGRAERAEAKTD